MTMKFKLQIASLYCPGKLLGIAALLFIAACSHQYTVSVNDQPVFDPTGRLSQGDLTDADLQGCLNIALQQQKLQNPALLRVLYCANSEVKTLGNIAQLPQLRFLDLSNNEVRDLSPLLELKLLGVLNLTNNPLTDISPLLNMPNLTTVYLDGNDDLPCQQLQALEQKLGSKLTPPHSCKD